MKMDVQQVKAKKQELEEAIRELVLAFEDETACRVEKVAVYKPGKMPVAVTVEVTIP